MAAVPPAKRRILSSHDSLQYLARAYGVTMLAINGWTNNNEPSAAELASLAQRIRQEGIHALFLDSITDPRAMQHRNRSEEQTSELKSLRHIVCSYIT